MAFVITNIIGKSVIKTLEDRLLSLSLQSCSAIQMREKKTKYMPRPKLRNPTWFTRKNRVLHNELVTKENQEFIQEVVQHQLSKEEDIKLPKEFESTVEWSPSLRRTGVIARKIGQVPLWLKNGEKINTTMLQVLDNHVIKYYTPEEYDSPRKSATIIKNKKSCLLLGAESSDPTLFTKEYCGLFKNSGVMPKKFLARFFISTDAKLPPGTPINAMHFQVGNYIDVRGKTKDRGFQGVMKRHGFKGMPASHGVTKTHRRGGNIGGGGEKGRVWPGTKMPGHMGNRYRIAKGLKIWRMNTKYNVIWVSGPGIPGETNSIVTIYDTLLIRRKPTAPLPFPTYFANDDEVPEDIYDEKVHKFIDPTIVFSEK